MCARVVTATGEQVADAAEPVFLDMAPDADLEWQLAMHAYSFSLSNVYGDHMVLQRGKPIRVAGTATPGARIVGVFLGCTASVDVVADGAWVLEFPPAEAGGPYRMTIRCECNSASVIELDDILVGDVWFCSGQSNMEFPLWGPNPFFRLRDGQALAAAAHDGRLRLFQTTLAVCPDGPCAEAPGRSVWRSATTPEAVLPFSAVGYWFGKTLREALEDNIPIGLVNSSWGGTPIEAWIPEEAFHRAGGRDEDLAAIELARLPLSAPDPAAARRVIAEAVRRPFETWLRDRFFATDPAATAEALAHWAAPDATVGNVADWKRGPLARLATINRPSVTWLRREFTLPESLAGCHATLRIGAVNDCDETFLDGARIGATDIDTPNYWDAPRRYELTLPAMPGGRHVLAVRVIDHYQAGGLQTPVELAVEGVAEPFDLAGGEWMRRVEFTADIKSIGTRPVVPTTDPRTGPRTPATLYNAMVAPFTAMNIRGVVWYQGCDNSGKPDDYLVLSRIWTDAWRRAWRDQALPILVTQLSAFADHRPDNRLPDDFWRDDDPDDRLGFAPLRASQERLAAEDPLVGLACTIDIGDHSDVHPANKRDVGLRLANEALRIAYGRADARPGPRIASVEREGDALRLRVSNADGGLLAGPDGAIGPHLFAVAGADGRFAWADARLDADASILVRAAGVPEPVSVRYAFSAYPPGALLRRASDGLPVHPYS